MTPQATPAATNGVARLSIDDAARALGVSRPTVRRRLRNGVLKGSQVVTPHGRKWLVELSTPHDSPAADTLGTQGVNNLTGDEKSSPGAAAPPVKNLTPTREVALLQAHVDDLRRQLEDRAREVRELHTLLAQAHQRLLTEGPVSPHGESVGTQAERRPWWRRLWWGSPFRWR